MSRTSRERRKAARQKSVESHVENVKARLRVIAQAQDTPVFVCKRCEIGSARRPPRDRCPQCHEPIMVLPRNALSKLKESTP